MQYFFENMFFSHEKIFGMLYYFSFFFKILFQFELEQGINTY